MTILTIKQERFCREYVLDLNGTQAVIRAGYSEKGASVQATRLLSNPRVKQRVSELLKHATEEAELSLAVVMQQLKKILESNISDYSTWSDSYITMKPSCDLARDQTSVIESIYTASTKDGTPQVRVKLHNKLKAAELILKVLELAQLEGRLAELEEAVMRR